jgi:hypothetical protein
MRSLDRVSGDTRECRRAAIRRRRYRQRSSTRVVARNCWPEPVGPEHVIAPCKQVRPTHQKSRVLKLTLAGNGRQRVLPTIRPPWIQSLTGVLLNIWHKLGTDVTLRSEWSRPVIRPRPPRFWPTEAALPRGSAPDGSRRRRAAGRLAQRLAGGQFGPMKREASSSAESITDQGPMPERTRSALQRLQAAR